MKFTDDVIHKAADDILESGENPTLARVRAKLGGGSFTTISEAMKTWRDKTAAAAAPAPIVMPIAVNEAVEAASVNIWQAAQAAATGQLNAERDALTQAREDMEEAARQAASIADTQEEELEALRNQLVDAQLRIEQSEGTRRNLQVKASTQEQVITGMEAGVQEIASAHERENKAIAETAKISSQLDVLTKAQQKAEKTISELSALEVDNTRLTAENKGLQRQLEQQEAFTEKQDQQIKQAAQFAEKQADQLTQERADYSDKLEKQAQKFEKEKSELKEKKKQPEKAK